MVRVHAKSVVAPEKRNVNHAAAMAGVVNVMEGVTGVVMNVEAREIVADVMAQVMSNVNSVTAQELIAVATIAGNVLNAAALAQPLVKNVGRDCRQP